MLSWRTARIIPFTPLFLRTFPLRVGHEQPRPGRARSSRGALP
jgi:hypothetical protein